MSQRTKLERRWHERLNDAKLRLDFARNYMVEIQGEVPLGSLLLEIEGDFEFQEAIKAETVALADCERVLRIYTELTLDGIIPNDTAWLKVQAANACGAESNSS